MNTKVLDKIPNKKIGNLNKSDLIQLVENLLDTMIKATAFNPSVTLGKKHGDKMPLQEVAEEKIKKP